MKTAVVHMRMEPALKEAAEEICAQIGLGLTDALNVLIRKFVNYGGFPFPVAMDRANAETLSAMDSPILNTYSGAVEAATRMRAWLEEPGDDDC
ncbi:MAG: type II toxin-antitoxin system RelB/DinJ family antitoxin [Oscillospiraceae bacterium]|jgi:addiction module RelB/DinJ family antitoxin|nr:type II toxin-antitoxin system RelB/DinJ family antitoxin [Oscillospiraceae bacterium]